MPTKFVRGSIVRALASVQGLTEGFTYEVVGVDDTPTPFGTVTTYTVSRVARREDPITVNNGHLVLEEVD